MGMGYPLPSRLRGLGERCKLPQWVRDGFVAFSAGTDISDDNEFGIIIRPMYKLCQNVALRYIEAGQDRIRVWNLG